MHSVEQRLGDIRTLRELRWLTDNDPLCRPPYQEIAAAPNPQSCFTPIEAPRAMARPRHLKAFRRDYLRVKPIFDVRDPFF